MEKIGKKEFNICIDDSYQQFEKILKEVGIIVDNKYIYDAILILTDKNVCKYQLDKLITSINFTNIHKYVLKSGEESKTIDSYMDIINFCIEKNLSRKSLIIGLGGGVIGDIGGFVSSTYMRGIDLIQIPTTLLSQVDSSVGGKTGINIGDYKNIIGTFYQPRLTYININSLNTLSGNEYKNGLCEVIKYGFIYDYKIIEYMLMYSEEIKSRDYDKVYELVKRCIEIKSYIVSEDEKENGIRKILNFGHTFGHGIEKLHNISHGYAINIGMNMAFKISLNRSYIDNKYYNSFIKISELYDLPISFKEISERDLINLMRSDKKNSFGNINLVIPVSVGKVEIIDDIKEEEILTAIRMCKDA